MTESEKYRRELSEPGLQKSDSVTVQALLTAALLKMRAEPYAFVTDISMWI